MSLLCVQMLLFHSSLLTAASGVGSHCRRHVRVCTKLTELSYDSSRYVNHVRPFHSVVTQHEGPREGLVSSCHITCVKWNSCNGARPSTVEWNVSKFAILTTAILTFLMNLNNSLKHLTKIIYDYYKITFDFFSSELRSLCSYSDSGRATPNCLVRD